MKRFWRISALLLAVLLLCPALAGCSEPVALSLGDVLITRDMFSYWYSQYKNYFLSTFGGEDSEEYFEKMLDAEKGLTVGAYFDGQIRDVIDSNAVTLYLFDSYGLTLSSSVQRDVEQQVQSEIENAGGRSALNGILGRMGANVDTLRAVLEAEAKINAVYTYLFGDTNQNIAGKAEISDAEKVAFYEKYYVCVRHILLRTEEKNVVGEDGYAMLDEDGNVITEPLTAEEKAEKYDRADKIMASLEDGGDFDALMEEYNEDSSAKTYEQGYLIAPFSGFDQTLTDTALGLEIGEYGKCETAVGIHILIRDPLPEKPWTDKIYATMLPNFDVNLQNEYYAALTKDLIGSLRRNLSVTDGFAPADADITFWTAPTQSTEP